MSIWPDVLPQEQFLHLTDKRQDARVRTQNDAGPTKMRRRFTAATRDVTVPIVMCGAQRVVFDAFYVFTLQEGTLAFDWEDPVTDTVVSFRFRPPPPSWELVLGGAPDARLWQTMLNLEVVPLGVVVTGGNGMMTDAEIEAAYNRQVAIITQAEAQAGTAQVVRRFTAQRVAQAIAALAPAGGGGGMTNAQVEAAYNAQVPVITQGEAEAGTSTVVRRFTAERVKQAILALSPPGGTQDLFTDVEDYGAIGNDATDNSAAYAAARTAAGANRPISAFNGDFNEAQITTLYGSQFEDALGMMMSLGTAAAPATRHEPLIRLEKVSTSNRTVHTSAFDQGCIFASLEKVGGTSDAFMAAVTGHVRQSGGTGDCIGMHMRAVGVNPLCTVFGGWAYAQTTVSNPNRVVGFEIDVDTGGFDPGWSSDAAAGAITGLVIATNTPNDRGTQAIRITELFGDGFWTGLQVGQGAILGNTGTTLQNGEAVHIHGGVGTTTRIGGVRLGTGHFGYGLTTTEATIGNNAAILLGDDHRIVWGTDPNSGLFIAGDTNTSLISTSALAVDLIATTAQLRINGNKVIGPRDPGWSSMTGGTAKGGGSTTGRTADQLGQILGAVVNTLINHGMLGA